MTSTIFYIIVLAAVCFWPPLDQWFRCKRKILAVCIIAFNLYTLWNWYSEYFGNSDINDNGSVVVGMFVILPVYILIFNVVAILIYKFVVEFILKVPKFERQENFSGVTNLVKEARNNDNY